MRYPPLFNRRRLRFAIALQCLAFIVLTSAAHSQIAAGVGARRAKPIKNPAQSQARVKALTSAGAVNVDITSNTPAVFHSMINDDSKIQTITVHNGSTTLPYRITSTTITVPGSGTSTDFTLTPCDVLRLDVANPDCPIKITYSPTKATDSEPNLVVALKTDDAAGTQVTLTVPLEGLAASTCATWPGYQVAASKWFFPLDRRGVDGTAINCYFGTAGNLAFVTQAQYQYNPVISANVVSADLASFQFLGGFQVTLAGNANTTPCSASTTSSGSGSSGSGGGSNSCTTPTAATTTSTTATSGQTAAQTVQSIEQGGDFALKALWPIFRYQSQLFQLDSILSPQMSFSVAAISGQQTATSATEVNSNIVSEGYLEFRALPAKENGVTPAALYADYRFGWQNISSDFEKSAGLNTSNFLLQQFTAGIVMNQSIRIAAERYWGPSQAYVNSSGTMATANNFSGWQLRVQITPSAVSSGGQ